MSANKMNVKELKELKAMSEELAQEITAIEDAIKAELTARNAVDKILRTATGSRKAKTAATAKEVRDTFLVKNIGQAVSDIAQTMEELMDYKASKELLVNCCTSQPEEQWQGIGRYDRLCWIARQAFLAGYLHAAESFLKSAEAGYKALFAGRR